MPTFPTLGLHHHRVHDARRTFVSIARSNGARAEVLRDITHAPARTVFDMYTSFSWEAKCETVLSVKVLRDRGQPRDGGMSVCAKIASQTCT